MIPNRRTLIASGAALVGAAVAPPAAAAKGADWFDNRGRADVLSGGARMIPIETPKGKFRVWTKRAGNNPRVKLLLLHGGPGSSHEYFECFDSFLPAAGVEYYYYDQLGSAYSDNPADPDLWSLPRFVDEVEQVRRALGLSPENFFLLGHSWGGILAMEYALKHGDALKGLIISNMMSSCPAYTQYAETVLMPQMDQALLAEARAIEAAGDYQNPRYMEILTPLHYEKHVLRMPASDWPDPVVRAFARLNYPLYLKMQGPSELGLSGDLAQWDRTDDLPRINIPALVTVAAHDTMDPAFMRKMAGLLPKGRALELPNGSHMAMYDDQPRYMAGVTGFLRDVDKGRA